MPRSCYELISQTISNDEFQGGVGFSCRDFGKKVQSTLFLPSSISPHFRRILTLNHAIFAINSAAYTYRHRLLHEEGSLAPGEPTNSVHYPTGSFHFWCFRNSPQGIISPLQQLQKIHMNVTNPKHTVFCLQDKLFFLHFLFMFRVASSSMLTASSVQMSSFETISFLK